MAGDNGAKFTPDAFATVRIDKLIDTQGGHFRDLESRVKRLEEKVFSPES